MDLKKYNAERSGAKEVMHVRTHGSTIGMEPTIGLSQYAHLDHA